MWPWINEKCKDYPHKQNQTTSTNRPTFLFRIRQLSFWKFHIERDKKRAFEVVVLISWHALILFADPSSWMCYLVSNNVYLQGTTGPYNIMGIST